MAFLYKWHHPLGTELFHRIAHLPCSVVTIFFSIDDKVFRECFQMILHCEYHVFKNGDLALPSQFAPACGPNVLISFTVSFCMFPHLVLFLQLQFLSCMAIERYHCVNEKQTKFFICHTYKEEMEI